MGNTNACIRHVDMLLDLSRSDDAGQRRGACTVLWTAARPDAEGIPEEVRERVRRRLVEIGNADPDVLLREEIGGIVRHYLERR